MLKNLLEKTRLRFLIVKNKYRYRYLLQIIIWYRYRYKGMKKKKNPGKEKIQESTCYASILPVSVKSFQ
jgi:hypothetical protein